MRVVLLAAVEEVDRTGWKEAISGKERWKMEGDECQEEEAKMTAQHAPLSLARSVLAS